MFTSTNVIEISENYVKKYLKINIEKYNDVH